MRAEPGSGGTAVPLAPFTTLRLGGPAASLVEVRTEAEAVAAIGAADAAGLPVLLVGGGSSLVIGDAGWPGLAVLLRVPGRSVARDPAGVTVTVAAGEPWDEVVAETVAAGWAGLECLSGIPGLAGAAVVENVAAWGQELADTATGVRVFDRTAGAVLDLTPADCRFGYRDSAFLHSDRYLVLAVTLRLRAADRSAPIGYADLAEALGVPVGGSAPLAAVRAAALDLRRRSGRLVDPTDPDTWSVGSFFVNPILPPDQVHRFEARLDPGTSYPSWPAGAGTKLSAAWLVRGCGIGPGYGSEQVGISRWHPLALVHRGGGSTAELVALARTIRDSVQQRYGVALTPQPRLVGVTL